jgi:hypothetical protein
MIGFLKELKNRNGLLYWYGWFCFLGALVCLVMTQISGTMVLGINAWIKPLKFFISIAVFCWTIAWFLFYLTQQRKVRVYSWMVVWVMSYELFVITWQAANGRLSHFNVVVPLYRSLFVLMGVAISLLVAWTGYMGYLFFRQKKFSVPMPYVWGIRLGIILFVIFSFEGGIMASHLAHTIGAPDGGPGIGLFNWSRQHGDLRVAHFIGVHALQVLPLFGYYLAKNNRIVQWFAALYFLATALLFFQAIKGLPLIR